MWALHHLGVLTHPYCVRLLWEHCHDQNTLECFRTLEWLFCIRATIVRLPSVLIANNGMFSCNWVVMNGFFCIYWSWHSALQAKYVFMDVNNRWYCYLQRSLHRYQNMFSCMRIIDEKTFLQHLAKFDKHAGWSMWRVARVSLAPQPLTGKLTSGCLSLGPDTHYFNKMPEVHSKVKTGKTSLAMRLKNLTMCLRNKYWNNKE